MGSGVSSESQVSRDTNNNLASPKSVVTEVKIDTHNNGHNDKSDLPTDLGGGYAMTKQAGGVATVIIKVGQEEYMNYMSDQTTKYGKLGSQGADHPLYKGKYVLMRDHEQEQPNVTQVGHGSGIFRSSQLDLQQTEQFLEQYHQTGVCVISIRPEAVFYAHSYSCHLYDCEARHKLEPDFQTSSAYSCDKELEIRKDLVNIATMTDDFRFFYYNTDCINDTAPIPFSVNADDDMLTLSEIISTINFRHNNHRFVRCPLSDSTIPEPEEIDALVSIARGATDNLILVTDYSADSMRCQFTACILAIIRGFVPQPDDDVEEIKEASFIPDFDETLFNLRILHSLSVQLHVAEFIQRKMVVDRIYDSMSSSNVRASVNMLLKDCMESKEQRGVVRSLTREEAHVLELYTMSIIFAEYWIKMNGAVKFTDWMNQNAELYNVFRSLKEPIMLDIATHLGHNYCLVEDSAKYSDNLASKSDCECSNMRCIPGMPIYGMTQPSFKGAQAFVKYLKKTKDCDHVIMVSLREDAVVLCNGEIFSLRHEAKSDDHVFFPQITSAELDTIEDRVLDTAKLWDVTKILRSKKDIPGLPKLESMKELFSRIENMRFTRIPIDMDKAPTAEAHQLITDLVTESFVKSNSDKKSAIVFFCESGKERTTTAMAIAGIAYCSAKGYPYGAGKGEAERISIWDAQYTKGEYKMIQKLVSLVPTGHQIKREVDFILDQCYEMSSMMHYHAREDILIRVKKKQKLMSTLRDSSADKALQAQMKLAVLHQQSLDVLERYAMFIIYNAYLKLTQDQGSRCRTPEDRPSFLEWLGEKGYKSGLLSVLDDLSFAEFEAPCPLKSRLKRYCTDINCLL